MSFSLELTEKAFKNTRHWIIPSIVSPCRQNVPLKCLLFRPNTVDNDACTIARRWLADCEDVAKASELVVIALIFLSHIKRSIDSIVTGIISNSLCMFKICLFTNFYLISIHHRKLTKVAYRKCWMLMSGIVKSTWKLGNEKLPLHLEKRPQISSFTEQIKWFCDF